VSSPTTSAESLVDEALRLLADARDSGAAEFDLDIETDRPGAYNRPNRARLRVTWERVAATTTVADLTDPAAAALPPVAARERLAWANYAPELREALKDLAARYPAALVADAAAELEHLLAEHGDEALARRRAARAEQNETAS